MTNYDGPGQAQTFTAPEGGVTSGKAVVIGSLVVIATETKDVDETFVGLVTGIVTVPRVDSEAWTEGLKIYFNPDASPEGIFTLETDDGASPPAAFYLVGAAVEDIDASPAQSTGKVRFDGAVR